MPRWGRKARARLARETVARARESKVLCSEDFCSGQDGGGGGVRVRSYTLIDR